MFRGENESSFLKIRLFLDTKLGRNCIELWPTAIVTKKDTFHIIKFFLVKQTFLSYNMYWIDLRYSNGRAYLLRTLSINLIGDR